MGKRSNSNDSKKATFAEFIKNCDKKLEEFSRNGTLPNINQTNGLEISKIVENINDGFGKEIEHFIKLKQGIKNLDELKVVPNLSENQLKKFFRAEKEDKIKKLAGKKERPETKGEGFEDNEKKLEDDEDKPEHFSLIYALPHLYEISYHYELPCHINTNYEKWEEINKDKNLFTILHLNLSEKLKKEEKKEKKEKKKEKKEEKKEEKKITTTLEQWLEKCNISMTPVMCISNTYNTTKDEAEMTGYKYYYRLTNYNKPKTVFDSKSPSNPGGVGMYIKDGIKCDELKSFTDMHLDNCDHLWVQLNDLKLVVGVVYRRHPINTEEKLKDFALDFLPIIDKLNDSELDFYIFGDFSIDLLENSLFTKGFCYELYKRDCRQLITKPTTTTRKKDSEVSKKPPTLHNHIYTNVQRENIEQVGIVYPAIKQDHPIYCTLKRSCN